MINIGGDVATIRSEVPDPAGALCGFALRIPGRAPTLNGQDADALLSARRAVEANSAFTPVLAALALSLVRPGRV